MAACPSPPSLPQLLPQPPKGSSSSHSCLYNALSTQLPEGILKMQTYAGHSPIPKPSKGFPSPHMITFKTPPHSICLAMLAFFLLLTHPKQDPTQAFCAQPSLPLNPSSPAPCLPSLFASFRHQLAASPRAYDLPPHPAFLTTHLVTFTTVISTPNCLLCLLDVC